MVSATEVFTSHADNPGYDPTVAELRRNLTTAKKEALEKSRTVAQDELKKAMPVLYERIVVTTATRTDKAKSLWATIAGTLWQMLWAVVGFFAGLPREIWLVVAIIAGVLAALFIYRQITLGKLREDRSSEFKL